MIQWWLYNFKFKLGFKTKQMRCGNSGKNWQLQKDLIKLPIQLKFESTALNMLQQNGILERKYAMLYGKVSAMILSNKLPKFFKMQL
jgi:hypothetical protein